MLPKDIIYQLTNVWRDCLGPLFEGSTWELGDDIEWTDVDFDRF